MAERKSKHKEKELIRIERESVIMTMKPRLVMGLAELLEQDSDREDFLTLFKRVDSTIRAWYHPEFEETMQLFSLFDPVHGVKNLEQESMTPTKVDRLEQQFLHHLIKILEKSNYKLLSNEDVEIATSGKYLLHVPIAVNTSKLDDNLFTEYYVGNPRDGLPKFANQYALFRKGIGIDRTTDYFFKDKVDILISRFWDFLIHKSRLRKLLPSKQLDCNRSSINKIVDSIADEGANAANQDLCVERIHIQNLELSLRNIFSKTTVQEATFEQIVLVYRCTTPPNCPFKYGDRAIHIKHFRNIPMADMELVLPEKKNPGLTPMDWTKLLISASLGLVTLVSSWKMPKANFWVVSAILVAVIGYCVIIFLSFQQNLLEYQNLIWSVYEKQLDSGRGTLLHMYDNVIQQEVKEVILAFFVLISQGRATIEDLDTRCEALLMEEFKEKCDFNVEDAVRKMERLGIVTRDSVGRYCHAQLKRANEIIGQTTEERVLKALV